MIHEREDERRRRRGSLAGSFVLPLLPRGAAIESHNEPARPERDVDRVERRVAQLETRVDLESRTEGS